MRWECRERISRHWLQRKPLINDPGMHHGTCVTHVPWCMLGSVTSGDGENVPGIPGACATRNFTYLARGLCEYYFIYVTWVTITNGSWTRARDPAYKYNRKVSWEIMPWKKTVSWFVHWCRWQPKLQPAIAEEPANTTAFLLQRVITFSCSFHKHKHWYRYTH